MPDTCRYYAMGGHNFVNFFAGVGKFKTVQGVLDQFIIDEWQCDLGAQAGLGQTIDELSRNADRFEPLDVSPLELQKAWKLLANTLSTNAEKLAWAKRFKRTGFTSPEDLNNLVSHIHKTKCLELLLPTPILGTTKTHILSLCRFLEAHNNGQEWILAMEVPGDTIKGGTWRIV